MDHLDTFSPSYLHQRLDYNPVNGVLTWNPKPGNQRYIKFFNTRFAGTPAGSPTSEGYLYVMLHRRLFRASRVIWKMTYGETPSYEIDHINHIRNDDRICNLRLADRSGNTQNQTRRYSNTSSYTGVQWMKDRKKWRATICQDRKQICLGDFDNKEDAVAARFKVEQEIYGEFSPLWINGYHYK